MPSRVRIGVVGLGQRALQHLRALWQLQQQEQVARVDLEEFGRGERYATFRTKPGR